MRDAEARALQLRPARAIALRMSLDQHALGDLQLELLGVHAWRHQGRQQVRRSPRRSSWRGETFTAIRSRCRRSHSRAWRQASLEHPGADRHIRPVSSAWEEHAGADAATRGWCQRSSASAPTMGRWRVDLRLVVQLELAAARAPGASPGERQALLEHVGMRREEREACAAAALAWYMAASALRSSSSAAVAVARIVAMPMLAET